MSSNLLRAQSAFAISGVITCVLTACAVPHGAMIGLDYRPAILQKNVDLAQYEKDRALCEQQIRQSASNYEPANIARFRQCLTDRGYKLMS